MFNRYLRQFYQSPDGLLHDDLNSATLDTVASNVMPRPVTIASASTIAPSTFLTFLSGTVPPVTITPPATGATLLAFVGTSATPPVTATTGNIAIATTIVQNKMLLMCWDPSTNKWYPSY